MMMKQVLSILVFSLLLFALHAQDELVNTSKSPYAKLQPVGMNDIQWTKGFWAERFAVCRDVMVPQLWNTYTSDSFCYAFDNFKIAAGLDTGLFRGPSFHDGDFYKMLEAVAAMYATTHDEKLNKWMDEAITVIAKAQRPDGYIYTKNIIEQKSSHKEKEFGDQLSFEAYNFGHLMTAACVHYRATRKATMLEIAKKAADFLIGFYKTATPEQARNAICPSHYMGLTELYRTTQEKKYLALAVHLIDVRGTVAGTDDNSDREPFREMDKVTGHAVRANYLFAGAADVYAETGDKTLVKTLNSVWDDVVNHKMYITGGCGALYDGVSVNGTSYKPDTIQQVHQAYGKEYELPNFSAHNETCANIGNVLWNWRMYLLTADPKYADIVELEMYNSVLSGVSLDGTKYFYTNPLAVSDNYPYHLRWEGGRQPYISKSNCCPPNLVRTLAELSDYLYSVGDDGLYFNLYGGNKLSAKLKDGSHIKLEETTNYPWDGNIHIEIKEAPAKPFAIHFRIPGWCHGWRVLLNGHTPEARNVHDGFYVLREQWKQGDKIEIRLDMPTTLVESNPLVEDTRNQVAVKRGPIVYCIESPDLPQQNIFDVVIPSTISFQQEKAMIGNGSVVTLVGQANLLEENKWKDKLYRELNKKMNPIKIKLIPYYAWANRGKSDMTVWLPLAR